MKITEFGDAALRQKAQKVIDRQLKSKKLHELTARMYEFLQDKKYGVGLAAPQIGEDLNLAIISIKPTENRKNAKEFRLTIMNPEITETFGRRKQLWEGCISAGPARSSLFAKVPRHRKIKLKYQDEKGKLREEIFEGLPAQVIQHEVDHLNGILYVDRVKDTRTFMTYKEYLRQIKKASSL